MNVEHGAADSKSNRSSLLKNKNIELNQKEEIKDYEIIPDNFNQYDFSFKVIIIGDTGVGKSCLTSKGVKDFYPINPKSTVGFEYFNFIIKLDKGLVKLNIWDTAGQEAYKSMVANFYRNSSLAILVYAIDERNSFDMLDHWLKELRTNCNPNVKVFLVGNKSDLGRQVDKEDAIKFNEENKIDFFLEASAKTGENVEKIFVEASKVLLNDYLSYMKIANESGRRGSGTNQNIGVNAYQTNLNGIYNENYRDINRASFLIEANIPDRNRLKDKSCSC